VKKVEIISGEIKDAKLRQCMMDQMKKWLFPASPNGKEVKATITFKIW
jgi:hypothetical protein